jgi:hypothetical protein
MAGPGKLLKVQLAPTAAFEFEIKSVPSCFKVQYPDDDDYLGMGMKWAPSMRIEHFPMSVNFATTGHKLQGKSVDVLVIAEWTSTYNWPYYVVLSRVRTLDGLFLLEPMPDHLEFAPDPRYVSMMERLRETILDEPITRLQHWFRFCMKIISTIQKIRN